jgi:hypothetical protein
LKPIIGAAAVQFPQRVALEDAEHGLGERFHAMGRSVTHLLLHTDKVAGQQEAQDLPAAVAQCLVAEGPALQQRVQRRVGLPFVDQRSHRAQALFAPLERLHEFEFIARGLQEQLQRPQRASPARRLGIGGVLVIRGRWGLRAHDPSVVH